MNSKPLIVHLLLLLLQMVLMNYLDFSPYLMVAILPVMIYILPANSSTISCTIIAFVSGLAVDIFCDGIIGLNALALTPVGFFRKSLFDLILGKELSSRKSQLTIKKIGFGKVFLSLLIFISIYLLIYIWVDGASMRPLPFNLLKIGVSMVASLLVCFPLTSFSGADSNRK